jgi:hypothetical protein
MTYSRDEGIQAIIDLQKHVGIDEPYERAAASWDSFRDYEKEQTELAHRAVCKRESGITATPKGK